MTKQPKPKKGVQILRKRFNKSNRNKKKKKKGDAKNLIKRYSPGAENFISESQLIHFIILYTTLVTLLGPESVE